VSGRNEPACTASGGVGEVPGDIAALIDAAAECRSGSRDIDRGKDAGTQEKRVRAGGVRVLAGDAASVVDSARLVTVAPGNSMVMKRPSSVRR